MAADDFLKCSSAAAPAEEEEEAQPPESLIEAPILLLLQFHKAVKDELAELRRIAAEASASDHINFKDDFVLDLYRRFEFLKLFHKYHSASEDEVIFLALDVHIKNVVLAYALEHKSIDELFENIFHHLNNLIHNAEDISEQFQQLVFCISTMETTICQHMLKEEKQVFPLLMQQFTPQKQASLVWQFICSVPIILLEDFLSWMTSLLPPEERLTYIRGIKEVVPKENLLQELVVSWFENKEQPSFGAYNKCGKTAQVLTFEDVLKMRATENHYGDENHPNRALIAPVRNPVDGISVWHTAIRKDLNGILVELCQVRNSNRFSNLDSLIVQLKFFVDILIFYSNALDKIFYPLWDELAKDSPSVSYKYILDGGQTEGLQRFLYSSCQHSMQLNNFVEKLCGEVDSFLTAINKHLDFLETQIFPNIRIKCSQEKQQLLLYTSLQMMPLGLLKCMITWFSTHLSEEESKLIMFSIKEGGPLSDKHLASLLCEWVRIGYSGKTSVENFRKDLRQMFDTKCSFPSNRLSETNSIVTSTSSSSTTTKTFDTLYSSAMNMHVFFTTTPRAESSGSSTSSNLNLESSPMDHIILFHKALKKDLENLVILSAELVENLGFLPDFYRRFHHIRYLYQMHSDSEDDVAFPALEAKGTFQNVSNSYAIDHKLEVELFNKISVLLGEISEFRLLVINGDVEGRAQRMLKYRLMCVKLHDMCLSMRKIVFDHIHHEEIEIWPLFKETFSVEEQVKIIGCMLGRTRPEMLQEMIPWLMASLAREEQHALISVWQKATKNTMFREWLEEWCEGTSVVDTNKVKSELNIHPSSTADPVEVVLSYISREGFQYRKDDKVEAVKNDQQIDLEGHRMGRNDIANHATDQADKVMQEENHVMTTNQEEVDAEIIKVSQDSSLDPEKKASTMQNILISGWISTQQQNAKQEAIASHDHSEECQGQIPSYRDPVNLTFGCKHYKRNCKILASCCNKLFACIHCHDDSADHLMDRKATTKMMCMKCLIIQPIGSKCSTASCHDLSMAKYYCRICKIFDDEREIYHCPFCNLCRVRKKLEYEYFHCMKCNACMSRNLLVHICREKSYEDLCPICREFMFSSTSPVMALQCGHLMHNSCFQEYTHTHYTCPICSKSLGDMMVYFGMIDALLAEQKMPDEYAGQTQEILCNDCEKRGTTAFHWLYHKCSCCGSYNTRLL